MKFLNKLKQKKIQLIAAVTLASFAGLSLAVTAPVTFTAGTTAKAADVNSNFSALATAITALEAKLSAILGTNKALASSKGTLGYVNIGGTIYTVNGTYALTGNRVFNASGGAVTLTRTGIGTYTVTFVGLGPGAAAGYFGNVQITAIGLPVACGTIGNGWYAGATPTDLVIDFQCYNPTTGVNVDAGFSLLFVQ